LHVVQFAHVDVEKLYRNTIIVIHRQNVIVKKLGIIIIHIFDIDQTQFYMISKTSYKKN